MTQDKLQTMRNGTSPSNSSNAGEEFVVVDTPNGDSLPIRSKTPPPAYGDDNNLKLDVHSLQQDNGVLVSIRPPQAPADQTLQHVPCDIVLVIDVSGSMEAAAPLPDVAADAQDKETSGLSILDLTKHAARTILETLNESDRLGVVTFASEAKMIQPLTKMTKKAREATWTAIDKLTPTTSTNLWDGIRTGLLVFDEADLIGNVQGLYILTDGQPNTMCPAQGYVAKLEPLLAKTADKRGCVPTLNTFGFGYEIRSELMQSIAEVGNGNYAFIPDAGMIGTVFVHAVANLFNTFATSTVLEVELLSEKGKGELSVGPCHQALLKTLSPTRMHFPLGNLHYGHSREVVLKHVKANDKSQIVARLSYALPSNPSANFTVEAETPIARVSSLPPGTIDYHVYRTKLCDILAELFPYKPNGEHTTQPYKEVVKLRQQCLELAKKIEQSQSYNSDDNLKAVHDDLVGQDSAGQVTKALILNAGAGGEPNEKHRPRGKDNYWQRWGQHYLSSLLHAHRRQTCNSFKDPGPLRYGIDAPLFIKCRDELDAVFDNLPAPKPTRPPPVEYDRNGVKHVHAYARYQMSSYNSVSNPCFEGNCKVLLHDGQKGLVRDLKPGSALWTPVGARKVAAVVKTTLEGSQQPLCRISDLWVTPWHPIKVDGKWVFPAEVAEEVRLDKVPVFSILLEPSTNPDAHAVKVGGQICITLGHGVVESPTGISDVRAHSFFGNYDRVAASLAKLSRNDIGQLVCGGIHKDDKNGLADDFLKASENVACHLPPKQVDLWCPDCDLQKDVATHSIVAVAM